MINKTILKGLYLQRKLSAVEIARELESTFPKVLYWIKKHRIPIRSSSERTYAKFNKNGDPFSPKQRLTTKEKDLLLLALALYWGEGNRKSKYTVKLANLDHRVLQVFIKFLREIARVNERKLRLDVRVYREFNLEIAKHYWSRCLSLRPERVFVYPHTDPRSHKNGQWSKYGIATLSMNNIKLKKWLDHLLEQWIGKTL